MLGLARDPKESLISLNGPPLPLSWTYMSHRKPHDTKRDTRLLPPSPFHTTRPHKQYESICLEHLSGCLKHTHLSPWQIPPSEKKRFGFFKMLLFYFMFIPSLSLNFYLPCFFMTHSGDVSKLFILHTDFSLFNVLRNAIAYIGMMH